MDRSVSCRFDARLDGTSDIIVSVAVAADTPLASESMAVTLDGAPVAVHEVLDQHGTRLHVAPALGPGRLDVAYAASISGTAAAPSVDEMDLVRYVRPSRYCESDRLAPFARAEFGSQRGPDLLDAVSSWVGMRIAYIAGSSRPTDGAVATLLAGQGVCRDFAHLVVAILRSCDTPARLAAVYAPGLQPMDFHAVAEAYVDGRWVVVDATCLAPRPAMVRIATGRDAADTAFLTSTGDRVDMGWLDVMAITDGPLPDDDLTRPVHLG
ncbi:transglutaminase-like domain-containing protein [Aquihabitans sp. McL0605]|uniref:transglutaminase-like domain-containing protein n=1 Tax=Aquihabitans sp. McL0605 TaxID=3415671 RepID=UPI003CF60D2F